MTGAYAAIGAAMLALAIVFLGRAGKAAEPEAARKARLAGALFLAAGLLFSAAALIAIFKDQ